MEYKRINKETGELLEERGGAAATPQSGPVRSRPVASRLPMDAAKAIAETQIFGEGVSPSERVRLREVVAVLTEVYMMPDTYTLIVNGASVQLDMVKDVMRHLTTDMALYVLDRISGMTIRTSRRSLLRAMLYNEVFEFDGHLQQDMEDTMPLGGMKA